MGKDYRYKPNAGNSWNPLKRYPRNAPCFCGSMEKHKKCCGPKVLEYCTTKKARELESIWPKILAGKIRVQIGDEDSPPLTNPLNAIDDVQKQMSKGGQNG